MIVVRNGKKTDVYVLFIEMKTRKHEYKRKRENRSEVKRIKNDVGK
jgi:hypothetical protein